MANLRYFLDENLTSRIAVQLRRRGIDSVSAQEVGRTGQSIADSDQLAYATAEGRVLGSEDRHFIRLAVELTPHTGVILLQKRLPLGEIIEFLDVTARLRTEQEMRDHLHFCDW